MFPADEGRTKQEFKGECDINNIIERMARGYDTANINQAQAIWGDFSEAPDYKTASDAVFTTQRAFDELPARVRARFSNDPGNLLDFLGNEENRAEAEVLGLVEPAAEPPGDPAADPPEDPPAE